MAGDPTKRSLALRVILVHFAIKTHLYERSLSFGHVPKAAIGGSLIKLVLMVCNAT
jgi:hypothetical protein